MTNKLFIIYILRFILALLTFYSSNIICISEMSPLVVLWWYATHIALMNMFSVYSVKQSNETNSLVIMYTLRGGWFFAPPPLSRQLRENTKQKQKQLRSAQAKPNNPPSPGKTRGRSCGRGSERRRRRHTERRNRKPHNPE